MITKPDKNAIMGLSREQRLELLEFISESLADDLPPLSAAQKKLLQQRLVQYRENPGQGRPLNEVMARLRSRR